MPTQRSKVKNIETTDELSKAVAKFLVNSFLKSEGMEMRDGYLMPIKPKKFTDKGLAKFLRDKGFAGLALLLRRLPIKSKRK